MTPRQIAWCSAVVAAVLLAACGSELTVEAERSTPTPSASSVMVHQIGVDDTPRPELAAFLEKFTPGDEGYMLPPPDTLRDAVAQSSVVLVAEIEDFLPAFTKGEGDTAPGRTFGGLHYIYLRLKPTAILAGRLQPGLPTVDLALCCAPDAERFAALKAAVTSGQAVYFLRTLADAVEESLREPTAEERRAYTLTHFATVFVQGDEHVLAPMLPDLPERTDAKTEGQAYGRLSVLAQRVRDEGGPRG